MFECDPHEYIQHQNYPLSSFYNPRMNDITLVTDLVNHYDKDASQSLLGNLMDILSRYA